MTKSILYPTVILLILTYLMSGCGNDDDDGTDTGECGNLVDNGDGTYYLALVDNMDYSFSSTLDIQSTRVKSLSDITYDWSGLTQDMLGNDIDPMLDIAMITIVLWELSEDVLMDKLNDDDWAMKDIVAPGMIYTYNDTTSANYFSLLSGGGLPMTEEELLEFVDTETFAPEDHTYSIMLSTGTTLGQDASMLAFFNLDPDETNTEVFITNGSTDLEYTVDLNSLTKAAIPAETSAIVVDWTESLELNALGQEFIPTAITEAMLAHYPDLSTQDLEEDFLHLEELAETIWRAEIPAGTSVELSELLDDGSSFSGIDENGTWIFALMCGACSNPAPWFITVFETC